MRVPLLDLKAQFEAIRGDVLAAMARLSETQQFILGAEVEALERELADRLGVAHAVGVSSGTDALLVTLMAFGVGPGDEVVVPDYSFFATAGCVTRLGARPVFADIDPVTFNIDPAAALAACGPRTKAIIPVHLFGQSADIEPIAREARARGIAVIEDAAQAIDATSHGRCVGGIGDAGCFSFFPSKNLGAFGDGGLVTTNDGDLARRIRLLRGHGMAPKYVHHVVGGNFRLDALQAAVLRAKLPHLTDWTEARRRNAARYRRLFAEAGGPPVVTVPTEVAERRHVYNQFVIRVPDRDGVRAYLADHGVGTEVYYPVPFHLQPCYADLGHRRGAFPESEAAAATSLALPIYGELSMDQQRFVVERIAGYHAR